MKRFVVLVLVGVVVFGAVAGRLLVVNTPEKADAIVVLAGGRNDNRYYKAMELLQAGYAPQMYLDALADNQLFGHREAEYAQRFVEETAGPEKSRIKVCGVHGDSTIDETAAVAYCLQHENAHRILLVTSEYHTRRARAIFERTLPGREIAVAAAPDVQFNVNWWQNREWAKLTLQEWQKLLYWEIVERWRARRF